MEYLMANIKFYMNNPCEIIRKITDEFSEVKVYPQFMDDELSGAGWCSACMVGGHDGAHHSHTCEPYQEVIEAIRDTESSMIIVVENRLLQDNPVEFSTWTLVREQVNAKKAERDSFYDESRKLKSEISEINKELIANKLEIEYSSVKASDLRHEIDLLSNKKYQLNLGIQDIQDSITVGGIRLSISGSYLRECIESKIKLEHLEAGGVDNWEWYGDSLPENIDDLVQAEIETFTVKGI